MNPCQGINVELVHVFSVELDQSKRNLLLKQHKDVQHCFADVSVFEAGRGFCHVCGGEHEVSRRTLAIDMLISGPSCKDLSGLKSDRRKFTGCYETTDPQDMSGTSGPTYRFGFKKACGWLEIDFQYL